MTAKKTDKTAPKAAKKAKTKTAAKPASKPETKPETKEKAASICLCGCQGTCGGKFCPGHDAKLASALLAAFRSEDGLSVEQEALVEQLGWESKVCRPAPEGKTRTPLERARALVAKLTDAERAALLAELEEAKK